MKKAAVYARYSTDLQNDQSVEDQIDYCRELAKRNGLEIDEEFIFFDRAKSATTMFDRPGLLALMQAAKQRSFQYVISECLDRLSRDPEDLPAIKKRLTFAQIKIITNEGEANDFMVGLRSIIGSQAAKDSAEKVRRHHNARAREGKIPGSSAYGYRCIPGKPSEKEKSPEEAAIVVRIFTEYANGKSTRDIAAGLTRDGIPNPSGGTYWNHQIFTGARGRGGILSNQIYIGKLVWNTTRGVRSPYNGKIIRQANKPEDVITLDVPHLRIVSQELWERVNGLIDERGRWRFGPTGKRPKRESPTLKTSLLSGLVICGKCGGKMILTSSRRLVVKGGKMSGPFAACNAAHYHGSCDHRKSYDLAKLERGVLKGMKEYLTDPAALIEATKAYHAVWAEKQKADQADRNALEARVSNLEIRLDRAITMAIENEDPTGKLKARVKELEVEFAGASQQLKLAKASTNVVTLHPAAIEQFKSDIDKIHAALSRDLDDEISRLAFRNVFERFVLHPTAPRVEYEVTPYARVAALMGMELFPTVRTVDQIIQQEQHLTGTDLLNAIR